MVRCFNQVKEYLVTQTNNNTIYLINILHWIGKVVIMICFDMEEITLKLNTKLHYKLH